MALNPARPLYVLFVTCLATGLLTGCASAKVQRGAAIGALSGVAAGGGVGLLITDEKLLGSPATAETGDTSLPRGEGIAASLAVGAVVGAVIGAMVGHQQESRFDEREPLPPPPSDGGELDEETASAPPPRAF